MWLSVALWGMAELKSQLRADLTAAMKAQDKLRTATLRMLLAAIQAEEVAGKQARELTDEDVLKVLAREPASGRSPRRSTPRTAGATSPPKSTPRRASSTSTCPRAQRRRSG